MPPPRSLAVYVASKVVRHARNIKNLYEDKMWCLDCKLLPKDPVTGPCGHTRCSMCIKTNGACPCGAPQPESLHSNILVRDIIQNMMSNHSCTRVGILSSMNALTSTEFERSLIPTVSTGRIRKHALRSRVPRRQPRLCLAQAGQTDISLRRMVASPQLRFECARELLSAGRHRDAAAHLAHVAASADPIAKQAWDLLAQVINSLSPNGDPRRLTRDLFQSVRQQSITACVDPSSIECPVCYNVLEQPVTTTCGHTLCRGCIKRTMQTRNICPLCSSSLRDFYLARTGNTEFVCAVLGKKAAQSPIDPDFIPIFDCTVAFPDISCPLMIFDSDLKNMVLGELYSGSRRFGMVTSVGDTFANYGTIVEVRDCVVFEDGRSILSTIGISRFRVLQKLVINECRYARIEEHTDIISLADVTIFNMKLLAQQINSRVQQWLPLLGTTLLKDITTCFGHFPDMNLEGDWWNNPNGPNWLWWLIAILPIRAEIQMLMLSTKHLSKRMTAVQRTLDAMVYYKHTYRIVKESVVNL